MPSIWNSTLATAMLSDAFAATAIDPVRPVARSTGAVTATLGGKPSSAGGGGTTTTSTAALVVAAPCVSVARALIECGPALSGVQENAYGLDVSVPSSVLPSKNSTLATPSSGSDAVALRAIALPGVPLPGADRLTVGGTLATAPPPSLPPPPHAAQSAAPR